ncbi:MAG: phosphate acyltransferase PlsX [Christensenellaceae bacterium]|jgi:glycerol-3-phosphate acyltransferase PlsX|nr:phosphate acyltransferase PlsX [Christensenellaceae bacterium]
MKKKIIVDCLGGDNGMDAVAAGAMLAIERNANVDLILIGEQRIMKPKFDEWLAVKGNEKYAERFEIVNAVKNMPYDEEPIMAVRHNPDSSMMIGIERLKSDDDCGCLVSAGSTGALLTGSYLKIGRIDGVSRPALCPSLPTKDGAGVLLIDCGANTECKVENLIHFAIMGAEYKKLSGINSPRIGLLNNGTEETKGNELARNTFAELKRLHGKGQINFVGNIEARDIFNGVCDVLVTDGWTGNILLKTVEGSTSFTFSQVKKVLSSGILSKIAALLVGKKMKKVKKRYSEETSGGAIFIGLNKPVIKAHGNSNADAISSAILYAHSVMDINLADKISEKIKGVQYG